MSVAQLYRESKTPVEILPFGSEDAHHEMAGVFRPLLTEVKPHAAGPETLSAEEIARRKAWRWNEQCEIGKSAAKAGRQALAASLSDLPVSCKEFGIEVQPGATDENVFDLCARIAGSNVRSAVYRNCYAADLFSAIVATIPDPSGYGVKERRFKELGIDKRTYRAMSQCASICSKFRYEDRAVLTWTQMRTLSSQDNWDDDERDRQIENIRLHGIRTVDLVVEGQHRRDVRSGKKPSSVDFSVAEEANEDTPYNPKVRTARLEILVCEIERRVRKKRSHYYAAMAASAVMCEMDGRDFNEEAFRCNYLAQAEVAHEERDEFADDFSDEGGDEHE